MLKKSGHLNSENKLTDRTEMHLKHWQFMKGTEYTHAYPFTWEETMRRSSQTYITAGRTHCQRLSQRLGETLGLCIGN